MAREYVVYTDESVQQGEYFAHFYGGALVRSGDLRYVEDRLHHAKERLNLYREVKWQKVSVAYLAKYVDLCGILFDLVEERKLKIRIMFTHEYLAPAFLDPYQREHGYHLLYYQFIKHAFGLRYADCPSGSCRVRLYLDRLPDTREKNARFKSYLCALSYWPEFKRRGISIQADQIAEVDSHDHVVMQLLDVVLGAMQFRLNDRHKLKDPVTGRRGKKTVAKEQLYRCINQRIRRLYPNFNIGISTGTRGDLHNLWLDSYRHWRFEPRNSMIDRSKSKRKPPE